MRTSSFYHSSESSKKKTQIEKEYAYVFPYVTDSSGDTRVLIGQKKVVSYPGQLNLELENPKELSPKARELISNLANKQYYAAMKNRFNGLFSYAGGKITCFGGACNILENEETKIKFMEDPETAAAREFLEETGINNHVNKSEKLSLIEEIKEQLVFLRKTGPYNFIGTYYALDIDACPNLKKYLTDEAITKEKQQILADENESLLPLEKRDPKLEKRISEMHDIKWVKLSKLEDELQTNPYGNEIEPYIKENVIRGMKILGDKLPISNEMKNKIASFVVKELQKESLQENVHSAKLLGPTIELNPRKTSLKP